MDGQVVSSIVTGIGRVRRDHALIVEVEAVGSFQGVVAVVVAQPDGEDLLVAVRDGGGKGVVRNGSLVVAKACAGNPIGRKLPVAADASRESVAPVLAHGGICSEEEIVVVGVGVERVKARALNPLGANFRANFFSQFNSVTDVN